MLHHKSKAVSSSSNAAVVKAKTARGMFDTIPKYEAPPVSVFKTQTKNNTKTKKTL